MRVIFDVDGALIRSVALDAELYDRAFREPYAVALPRLIARAIELLGGDGHVFYVGDPDGRVTAAAASPSPAPLARGARRRRCP